MKKVILLFGTLLLVTGCGKEQPSNKVEEEPTKTTTTTTTTTAMPTITKNYKISFYTVGDTKLDEKEITICLGTTCVQNNTPVPTPEQNGYIFEGWYYDSELTEPVIALNCEEIQKPIYENNEISGYEDIKLYAKWQKLDINKIPNHQAPQN